MVASHKTLLLVTTALLSLFQPQASLPAQSIVLREDDFEHHVALFNANDAEEDIVNLVPNADAWRWITDNAPLFECPSPVIEQTYYFRWWTFRKHIKQTPDGRVMTEFILPVSHAGKHNTVACALGHQIAEGRWLDDQRWLDEYIEFWFHSGEGGGPAPHFHKFSSWAAAAICERAQVTGDWHFALGLLDELVDDYRVWETERQKPSGLFWQHDVKDGMEESISGGRRVQNVRPTINSYMAANARAIAALARRDGQDELAEEFTAKYEAIHRKMLRRLWDPRAEFFKVRLENGEFSSAREAIGFIPWMFDLAQPEHAVAWRQLADPDGFRGPWGLTTAERRHPEFRTHGTGTCEWDGACWPFATSQTLRGLANVLRGPEQAIVNRRDFLEQLLVYAQAHQRDGKPYIGEYYDEQTGDWLITGPKERRSRFYNHSTFNDLVILGLVGIVPREDDVLEVDPLLPAGAWDWLCLDGLRYHDHDVTVLWDRAGQRYNRGAGLIILVDGREVARSKQLQRITVDLNN